MVFSLYGMRYFCLSLLRQQTYIRLQLKNFARVHDAIGIEDVLDFLHQLNGDWALGILQRVGLHGADAMFGRY